MIDLGHLDWSVLASCDVCVTVIWQSEILANFTGAHTMKLSFAKWGKFRLLFNRSFALWGRKSLYCNITLHKFDKTQVLNWRWLLGIGGGINVVLMNGLTRCTIGAVIFHDTRFYTWSGVHAAGVLEERVEAIDLRVRVRQGGSQLSTSGGGRVEASAKAEINSARRRGYSDGNRFSVSTWLFGSGWTQLVSWRPGRFFGKGKRLGPIQLIDGLCGEESDWPRWMAIGMGTDSTLGWLPAGVPARNNCRSGSRAHLYTPRRPILRSESGFGRCTGIRCGMRCSRFFILGFRGSASTIVSICDLQFARYDTVL